MQYEIQTIHGREMTPHRGTSFADAVSEYLLAVKCIKGLLVSIGVEVLAHKHQRELIDPHVYFQITFRSETTKIRACAQLSSNRQLSDIERAQGSEVDEVDASHISTLPAHGSVSIQQRSGRSGPVSGSETFWLLGLPWACWCPESPLRALPYYVV